MTLSPDLIMASLLSNSYIVGESSLKTDCGDYKVILGSSEFRKLVNKKPLFFQGFKWHDKEWNMSISCSVGFLS